MIFKSKRQLIDKFNNDIRGKKIILSSTGPHAVGDELEVLLGKKIDNSRKCDLSEINTEIKTKFKKGKITLGCIKPSVPVKELGERYGHRDGSFCTTVTYAGRNNLGLELGFNNNNLSVYRHGEVICKWDLGDIKDYLANKMPDVAYVKSTRSGSSVVYDSMKIYKNIDVESIRSLFEQDKLVVDFRLYDSQSKGKLIDKGTAFRLRSEQYFPDLFLEVGEEK